MNFSMAAFCESFELFLMTVAGVECASALWVAIVEDLSRYVLDSDEGGLIAMNDGKGSL